MVTNEPQLRSELMKYRSQDGTEIDAYMSRPSKPGLYPGVIVIMEAFGLVDHIKDVARRFASEGYIAIAPDMYSREGSPDPENMEEVMRTMFSVPDHQAMSDLEGAALYLKNLSDLNGRVGVIGFCSGGRYTLMLGCNSTNVNAAINSAGGFIIQDENTKQRPVSPIDMISTLSCPLLAAFGANDTNPSLDDAARLRAQLDRHGKTYEFRVYPNAGHAFFADYRPSYHASSAQDMWHRIVVFYEEHLKD